MQKTSPSEVRQKLRTAGFSPLPIVGKRPPLEKWETKINTNPDEIRLWDRLWPDARSTGILTRLVPTLDIDILNQEAAVAVEDLVRERYESDRGYVLVRIGRAPKRAIPFRTDQPFKKIEVSLIAPDGSAGQKIELLADGQQVVCFGIHPETNEPYSWFGGEPGVIQRDDLPYLGAEEARQLVEDAVELLIRDFGYQRLPLRSNGTRVDAEADGAADWQDLVRNILTGSSLHNSLRSLAAKMICAGTGPGAIVNHLRALMDESVAPRDDRWSQRYDDIPRLVETAEKFRAAPPSDTAPSEKPKAGLGEWNAARDVELPPPRGWLLGNSFCRQFVSSVIADGGTGKTALRYAQALSLATGRPLTGEHVFQRCRVLILSLEDDADELRRRVLAVRLHYNISLVELDGWLFLAAPGVRAGKLKSMSVRGQIVDGQLKEHLEAAIAAYAIDCVIIDPFVKSHDVEENSNVALDTVAQLLSEFASKYNMAVDVPHHVSKGAGDPGNANRSRGGSALINAVRLAYTLTQMSDTEAKTLEIADEQRRQYVRFDRAKVNLTPVGGPATWFKLVGVRLGNETQMYPNGDEVQTVEPWTPPETWADMDNALLNRILTEIDKGMPDATFYSAAPNAKTRAAWTVVCRCAPQKSEGQAREMIRAWVRSGALEEFDYDNPVGRKPAKGLRVDDLKRPGTTSSFDKI